MNVLGRFRPLWQIEAGIETCFFDEINNGKEIRHPAITMKKNMPRIPL